MNQTHTITAEVLQNATITALERTAMVFAEPASDADKATKPTRFARIRYSGPSTGTLTLAANDEFVREVASSLLGVDASEVSVEKDGVEALKEMANILGGSVIVAMSGDTCNFSLGLPEVVQATSAQSPADARTSAQCTVAAENSVLRVVWTQESIAKAA